MPINLSFAPVLDKRSPVGISSLIDSLRSRAAVIDPLKLADALDQLQQAVQAIMRALRDGPSVTGDSIQFLDPNGALGVTVNGTGITITSGGNTLTLTSTVVDVRTEYRVNGTKVMGARQTGWSAPTATQSRGVLANGATLVQVTQALAALIADLETQGTIGP